MDTEMLLNVLQEAVRREKAGGIDPMLSVGIGGSNQMTWTQYKQKLAAGLINKNVRVRTKETTGVTDSYSAHLYGCSGLFGLCGPDDIIGLSMIDPPLVSWLGFFPDTFCEKFVKGLTYMDQAGTAAGSVTGTVYGDACEDPPTSEKGVCEFFIGDFGTLRGCGESVSVANIGVRKCDKQPIYTLPIEGVGPVRIDNDLDLETIAATQLVKHELVREIITGDKTVSGQFEGLVNLVKTGYMSINGNRCTAMDSVVVDWASDDMSGAVNGHGSIITKVRDVVRRIKWRITQSGLGTPAEGDMVLVMPSWMAWQFLDEWAFWTFKNGTAATVNPIINHDAIALREYRDKYANGLYGGGYITVDGYNVHIIEHDWMAIDQAAPYFCSDIYVLTRSLGGRRVLNGQYVPVNMGADAVAKAVGFNYFSVETMQGGRALRWMKFLNACVQPCVLYRPRLWLETPWCQGVIQNVCMTPQFAPQSLDPQSPYFVEENLVAATNMAQYWYDSEGDWFHRSSLGTAGSTGSNR